MIFALVKVKNCKPELNKTVDEAVKSGSLKKEDILLITENEEAFNIGNVKELDGRAPQLETLLKSIKAKNYTLTNIYLPLSETQESDSTLSPLVEKHHEILLKIIEYGTTQITGSLISRLSGMPATQSLNLAKTLAEAGILKRSGTFFRLTREMRDKIKIVYLNKEIPIQKSQFTLKTEQVSSKINEKDKIKELMKQHGIDFTYAEMVVRDAITLKTAIERSKK